MKKIKDAGNDYAKIVVSVLLSIAPFILLLYIATKSQSHQLYDTTAESQYLAYPTEGPALKGGTIIITEKSDDIKTVGSTSGRSVRVPILIYHSVRPYNKGESAEQDRYDITPELFEEELQFLRDNKFTTIGFKELDDYLIHGNPLPTRPVILSFDDGWKNQFLYAFPLLEKYEMRGTFFIFSGAIGSRSSFMSWEDIDVMRTAHMEIQGHSYTHPILTKTTWSKKDLYRELTMSKEQIESHTHEQVFAFAYPFGMHDARIRTAVDAAGYSLARTTKSTAWQSEGKRLQIGGSLSSDSIEDFKKIVTGS